MLWPVRKEELYVHKITSPTETPDIFSRTESLGVDDDAQVLHRNS